MIKGINDDEFIDGLGGEGASNVMTIIKFLLIFFTVCQ